MRKEEQNARKKNSEAGNEKEVDYGRKSGQDNTSENVIENRPEKRVKIKEEIRPENLLRERERNAE